MQSRDDLRTDIQTEIRNTIRGAEEAAREAAQEAVAGQTIPPPMFLLDALRAEISASRARVDALTTQLTTGGPGRSARRAIETQLEQEGARLANLQSQLDAQLSSLGSTTGVPTPPFPPSPPATSGIGENALGVVFFVAVAVTIIGFPIARAFARWIDRRTAAPASAPESNARLERIEQAIEAVAIEVERVSEGQRYNTKLMTEMRGLPAPNPLNEWPPQAQRVPVSATVDKE